MKRAILILFFVAIASTAVACNIPVFRYALERWRPDLCELIVFHDGQLAPAEEKFVRDLESATIEHDGLANAKIIRVNLDAKTETGQPTESFRSLWDTVNGDDAIGLPCLIVRTKLGRGQTINHWRGSLEDARRVNLLDSPVRKELNQRLLRGDSVVWLLLKSTDKQRSQAARHLLEKSFEQLQSQVKLPEGIGLPGSELHSEVPLLVKFSLLEIDPSDQQEQFLTKLLTGFEPQAVAEGEPLLIPVFGRGRALEVIPARDLNENLIENMTVYLSGACSCQVKAQNPGFDLLMTADWDTQLFGEDGQRPPPAKTAPDAKPKLLTVPPGK